ncbi:MAG: hypothetical protein HOQ09_04790, partial [Gemmatimonadaceae bacterium]|nr:hypothetical protein [Gemmatimonadaceae bacterium]
MATAKKGGAKRATKSTAKAAAKRGAAAAVRGEPRTVAKRGRKPAETEYGDVGAPSGSTS